MVFKKSDIAYLKNLTSKRDRNKEEIQRVIELYEQRKIPRKDTAELLILKLQSSGKKKNKDALEKLESYTKKETITGSVKKAEDESINKFKKQIAVKKIQNTFRKRAKFEITENKALEKNVLEITVIPDKVGSILRSDVDAYIAKTFLQAKPKFKHLEQYDIYAIRTLSIVHVMDTKKKYGAEIFAKTKPFRSSELNKFYRSS
jgi:hypothetical protein